MSAICGIYHQNGETVCLEIGSSMLDGFKQYHADDCSTWFKGPVFLACHAQHITPESVNEKLPYCDEQADLTITADAIIDNRLELFDRLVIPHGQRRSMPDSLLILEAYKKWGKACPQYLIGDFTFVVWDGRRKEVFCATDAVGTRTLYYSYKAGIFAFSTLMKPLFVLPRSERKFNDIWIADFLAIPSLMHQLDAELTLYKDIYLLPAGHTLTVGLQGITKAVYWRITDQKELRLSSDAEYVEAFLDVFGEAVRCRMRSKNPVGVMMSGGLDSTSVACMAARELAERGQRLQAFSAVPMEGYQNGQPVTEIVDETLYIEAVKEYTNNIDIIYCRSEGRHSISDTSRFFAMLEQPYKVHRNLFWIDNILAIAQANSIGVMLNGAGGNMTISWGGMGYYALSLFKQGRGLLLLREAKAYANRKQCSYGKILIRTLLGSMPYGVQKIICQMKNGYRSDARELSLINSEFARHSQVNDRFRQYDFDPLLIRKEDSYSSRCRMFADLPSHMAPLTTKQSLAYSLVLRDPTLDRRVIEFCLSLPEEQYVQRGTTRSLIRRAMKGTLPDIVRLNEKVGVQSADWLQRILPCWREIVAEIRGIGELALEQKYLDIAGVQQAIGRFNNPPYSTAEDNTLDMLLRVLIFSRFLRNETKMMEGG